MPGASEAPLSQGRAPFPGQTEEAPAPRAVCVYCGSSPGADPRFMRAAEELGRLLAASGSTLVYGGACVGLMGAVADASLREGGRVIGVIPEALVDLEVVHRDLSELRVVKSMHERKALMANLSDAFIALPGGLGTLEEFLEVCTWGQLGIHGKPYGLLNVSGFFDPLLGFLESMAEQRFVRAEQLAMIQHAESPSALLGMLARFRPVYLPKWIDRAAAPTEA